VLGNGERAPSGDLGLGMVIPLIKHLGQREPVDRWLGSVICLERGFHGDERRLPRRNRGATGARHCVRTELGTRSKPGPPRWPTTPGEVMSTVQTTHPTATARSGRTVILAVFGALVAVAATVLVLALAGGTDRTAPTVSHHVATYYPLIRYRGTGAPPTAQASASTSLRRCAFIRPEHRCIWVP
jgi:hypothetical protein